MATAKPKTAAAAKAATPTTIAPKTAKPAAAAANSTTAETGLPAGFVSPFTRVEMQPNVRIDDGLCCIAMVANQSLDTITKAAHRNGLPLHGPTWIYGTQLIAILSEYGFTAEEKECPTIDALPDVAFIMVEFNPETQFGRWVLWHHVRATEKTPSFHYICDPASWIEPRYFVTTEIRRLITPKSPIHFLSVAPKTAVKGKSGTK
ncbi:hypothetical protein [Variovorax sp. E3]|uniref:hypothetical protein n=1 Tax=Variovorax sp. E3 TaxID=1914993 RepID=UPI0018DB1BEB|nr:hypothetical protein [Variovorax sp. E3]